jgi:hypothetical protein
MKQEIIKSAKMKNDFFNSHKHINGYIIKRKFISLFNRKRRKIMANGKFGSRMCPRDLEM